MTQLHLLSEPVSREPHTCGGTVVPATPFPSVVQMQDVPPPEGKGWLATIRSVRIATARYSNRAVEASGLTPVRITRGAPRFKLRYTPLTLSELAPSGAMLKMHDRATFERAFANHLATLDMDLVGQALVLAAIGPVAVPVTGKGVVLLCFEDLRKGGGIYCHRTQVACWLANTFGITVEELPE